MNRYIISAPRSGSNWLRFCIEEFCGVATPGKPLLFTDGPDAVGKTIIRAHDALNARRIIKKSKADIWRPIDPASTAGGKVLLVLRDPLELYVRMAHKHMGKFQCYTGNLTFYSKAAATDKMIVHYADLIGDPATMAQIFAFLELPIAEGKPQPSADYVAANWARAGEKSRTLYEKNQAASGGAHTRNNPLDFKYHQRKLATWRRAMVWHVLRYRLTDPELALLDRYRPDAPLPRPGPLARAIGWI